MGNVLRSIGAVIGRMFRALLLWAIVAGGGAIGWVALQSHRTPNIAEWGLVALVAVIAGLLGAVSTLAWELTHISQISRAARAAHARYVQHQSR
ncbi:MAG TPA: hypothetical protein VKB76_06335 [Ktedonobacterales bacterium]|nr:hypothetical protein [Ktedonobacterales bacterium]